jgi:hypothetical protein
MIDSDLSDKKSTGATMGYSAENGLRFRYWAKWDYMGLYRIIISYNGFEQPTIRGWSE